VPTSAEVALVHVEVDPRLEVLHTGRAESLILGGEHGFWRSICPPMRSEREWSDLVGPAMLPSPWAVSSAHPSILLGGRLASVTFSVGGGRRVVIGAPRRAMIRRRGKRGRIRRAEAAEAYENRNLLTSDARNLPKGEVHTPPALCGSASRRSTRDKADHLLGSSIFGVTRDGCVFKESLCANS
jgi:hypothetical protein